MSQVAGLRKLAEAMEAKTPILAFLDSKIDGDVDTAVDEALLTTIAADRQAIWPRAWRSFPYDVEFENLFESREIFGVGLVQTSLEFGLPPQRDVPSASAATKRLRAEDELLNTTGDAPPPVRGGRGRVREDNPPPRGKANTSRPASKHVDEYAGQGGPKRFQNSSRAPSKHVDDYQSAPVVRKIAPVDSRKPSEGGVETHARDVPGTQEESGDAGSGGRRPQGCGCSCVPGGAAGSSVGSGGAPAANNVGYNGGPPMPMHILEQQLGMSGGQGAPPHLPCTSCTCTCTCASCSSPLSTP